MDTLLTMKHLRLMVHLAYTEVERLRTEKSLSEGVKHVPLVKPVDIYEVEQAMEILEKLNDERLAVVAWNKAAATPVDHVRFDALLPLMKNFGVHFYIDSMNEIVNIQTEQETRRG